MLYCKSLHPVMPEFISRYTTQYSSVFLFFIQGDAILYVVMDNSDCCEPHMVVCKKKHLLLKLLLFNIFDFALKDKLSVNGEMTSIKN